jgi:hypothetical protein
VIGKLQRLSIALALSLAFTSAAILPGSMLTATPAEAGVLRATKKVTVGGILATAALVRGVQDHELRRGARLAVENVGNGVRAGVRALKEED